MRLGEYLLEGCCGFLRVGAAQRVDHDAQTCTLRKPGGFHGGPPDPGEGRPDRPPFPCDHGSPCPDCRSEEDIRGPVGSGVDTRVGDARGKGCQRRAEGRPHKSDAEGERHGRGRVARRHGGARGLGVDKPERRKVLRQRTGPRQQGLEPEIRDRGGHGLRQHPMQGSTPRAPGEQGHNGGDADPEFALVRRRGKPPEELVVVAPGEVGHGAYDFSVECFQPPRRLPQHASHPTTILPARAAGPSAAGGTAERPVAAGPGSSVPARLAIGWLG